MVDTDKNDCVVLTIQTEMKTEHVDHSVDTYVLVIVAASVSVSV